MHNAAASFSRLKIAKGPLVHLKPKSQLFQPPRARLLNARANFMTPFPSGPIDLRHYYANTHELTEYRQKYEDPRKPWAKSWSEIPTGYGYPPLRGRILAIEEYKAVREYGAGQLNYDWNRALYSHDAQRIGAHGLEIKVLASAVNRLPEHYGKVMRHLDVDVPAQVIAEYQVGQVVIERGFTSTSTRLDADGNVVPGRTNVVLVMESKGGGRSIQGMTPYNEDEVLFLPGTQFRVTARREAIKLDHQGIGWKYKIIEMEEVTKTRKAPKAASPQSKPWSWK